MEERNLAVKSFGGSLTPPSSPRKSQNFNFFKQRIGSNPTKYKLYSAFLNYQINKKIPTEEFLREVGLTASALLDDFNATAHLPTLSPDPNFITKKTDINNEADDSSASKYMRSDAHNIETVLSKLQSKSSFSNTNGSDNINLCRSTTLALPVDNSKDEWNHKANDSYNSAFRQSVNFNLGSRFTARDGYKLTTNDRDNEFTSSAIAEAQSESNGSSQNHNTYASQSESFKKVSLETVFNKTPDKSRSNLQSCTGNQHKTGNRVSNNMPVYFSDEEANRTSVRLNSIAGDVVQSSSPATIPQIDPKGMSLNVVELQKIMGDPNNNLRRLKFLLLSKKMYAQVSPSPNPQGYHIVSLMSKKSNKEIAPMESFKNIVHELHSRNNQLGPLHLSLQNTIAEIRKSFTFGVRDFGMTEDLVRKTIAKCEALNCSAKLENLVDQPVSEFQPIEDDSPVAMRRSVVDAEAFRQDICQIIASLDDAASNEEDGVKAGNILKKVAAIKKAGNPLHYARALKRKAEESKDGTINIPPIMANPVESMSLETSYSCLTALVAQMKKEVPVVYTGERRHYDRLNKSLQAAQLIVKRCQTLNNRCPNLASPCF